MLEAHQCYGNVGPENSKFYEDVPARGHLFGHAAAAETGEARECDGIFRAIECHCLGQIFVAVVAPFVDGIDGILLTAWQIMIFPGS
jgi:hypothetical protein